MKALKDYLGIWQYVHPTKPTPKFYQITPDLSNDTYIVSWGSDQGKLGLENDKRIITTAKSALTRLIAHQRGGYEQIKKYPGATLESADILVSSVEKKYRKNQPKPKDDFDFKAWLGGKNY